MPDELAHLLPHLTVTGRVADRALTRKGGGSGAIRIVDRPTHGQKIISDLRISFNDADADRAAVDPIIADLKATGVVLVLEAAESGFPLKLSSLDGWTQHRKTPKKPKWLLLAVQRDTADLPESAVVWVNDTYRQQFLALFEKYLNTTRVTGKPANRALVANIGTIKRAVLRDLWRSEQEPLQRELCWWELWLDGPDYLAKLVQFAEIHGLRLASGRLELNDRTIVWLQARWDQLEVLPFLNIGLAEVRKPEFIDTIEDLARDEHDEYTTELSTRIRPADGSAPAVCHLDTGVRRSHLLLSDSLAPADTHSVVDTGAIAKDPHGTMMAGLALFGPLDELLTSTGTVELAHRLESVKILPDPPSVNDPLAYGLVTAEAAATVETAAPNRARVYCMPITSPPETGRGEPTLWSAAVDALSVGTDIGRTRGGLTLIGKPDRSASRLFLISAGNVSDTRIPGSSYLDLCDSSTIETPAQSWNALTVGAHTTLTSTPTDPTFQHWKCVAAHGELSPHSRTSLTFGSGDKWPIKPDICMEGGNLITNGVDFHDHPIVCVRTTSGSDDFSLTSANATSAATAQAARLAAIAMATYPDYWPESIRGLLVHCAEWTPSMRREVYDTRSKRDRKQLLRRFGWGVPTETAVLNSAMNTVTLVTQDEFVPFVGHDRRSRSFRLHDLPWPARELTALAETDVQMRITLSYFVEPTASRRGWNSRYAYQSHGLRFVLRAPLETNAHDFIARVNRDAEDEEAGGRPPSGSEHWLLGEQQRTLGSLHQDIWEGSAADLAQCDQIAVYPVGGWWKHNTRSDREDVPVRYSLVVSLRTSANVDLYTPISTEVAIPTSISITSN
ncbi:S8 family peptidase [Nocardia takedensis]